MANGWDESAEAWIASIGEEGDFSRACVLDRPMLARVRAGNFNYALDAGCGEGRFSRLLQGISVRTVGIDPTARLIQEARRRDPGGDCSARGSFSGTSTSRVPMAANLPSPKSISVFHG